MPCIGIDLGTSKLCVAAWVKGRVEVVVNGLGKRTSPSCVAFTHSDRQYGEMAANKQVKNPKNTIYEVKRLIGRQYNDPMVQDDKTRWPFDVLEVKGRAKIKVQYMKEEREFHPEEIIAMMLQMAKESAQEFLGGDVMDAVVSVPAYFNDAQRQATLDAGKIAGLNVLRIINEPTAAALTYGLACADKLVKKSNILVYDLGGGTFDVSVVSVGPGMVFKVLATAGDTHLGGCDFDNLLVKHLADDFLEKTGKNALENTKARLKLQLAAKRAKHVLTGLSETTVDIDNLLDDEDFSATLTRDCFEHLCHDLFNKTLTLVKKVLEDVGVDESHIDEVVLVGGSTRIPLLKKMLQDFFRRSHFNEAINPDEAVAFGAAVMAAFMDDQGRFKDLSVTDIASHSIGMNALGSFYVVIPRNTTLPRRVVGNLVAPTSEQVVVDVDVFEVNRESLEDSKLLGGLKIPAVPTVRADVVSTQIEFHIDQGNISHDEVFEHDVRPKHEGVGAALVFHIDDNGLLKVSSFGFVDMQNSGLSPNEIATIKKNAVKDRAADDLERARSEARNQLEQYCYWMQSEVNSESSKFAEEQRQSVREWRDETLRWLRDNKMATEDELRRKLERLHTKFHSLPKKPTPAEARPSESRAGSRPSGSSAGSGPSGSSAEPKPSGWIKSRRYDS